MAGHTSSLTTFIATVAVTAAAIAMFAAPGNAAPYVTAPTLSVSTSAVCPGTPLTVAGTGFVPGSTVGLTLHPAAASPGSAVVSAAGGFTSTVTIPGHTAPGTHQIVASGPPTAKNSNTADVTVTVKNCVGPVPITGASGAQPGGTRYALPAVLAALALVLGGVLAWWRRRQKHAA